MNDQSALFDPSHPDWKRAEKVAIERYWNGRPAMTLKGLQWNNLTRVASLWNTEALFFFFECWYESLYVNKDWPTSESVYGLWEYDVAEVFLKPDGSDDYFEIEVSPLGQWLDVRVSKPRELVDFEWRSALTLRVVLIEEQRIWRAFLRLPLCALSRNSVSGPFLQEGDAWRVNLFRIAGPPSDRECLSWRPTFTREPDFHVPAAFGNLIFLGLQ